MIFIDGLHHPMRNIASAGFLLGRFFGRPGAGGRLAGFPFRIAARFYFSRGRGRWLNC